MFVPFACGATLVEWWQRSADAFDMSPEYLSEDRGVLTLSLISSGTVSWERDVSIRSNFGWPFSSWAGKDMRIQLSTRSV
jgi:hypothetical protein